MKVLTILAALLLTTCMGYAQDAGFTFQFKNPCCGGDNVTIVGTASRSEIKSKTLQEVTEYRVKVHGAKGSSIGELEGGNTYKQRGPAELIDAAFVPYGSGLWYASTVSFHMVGKDGCGFTVTVQLIWVGSDDKGWAVSVGETINFVCE